MKISYYPVIKNEVNSFTYQFELEGEILLDLTDLLNRSFSKIYWVATKENKKIFVIEVNRQGSFNAPKSYCMEEALPSTVIGLLGQIKSLNNIPKELFFEVMK